MKILFCPIVMMLITSLLGEHYSFSADRAIKLGAEVIPTTLSMYLEAHLPNLARLPKERANPEILEFLAKRKVKDPFACSGDFNGDSLGDFALLLRDTVTGTLKLLTFHRTRKQGYIHFVIGEEGKIEADEKVDEYLECEKPGKKRDVEGLVIWLKNDSISVAFWEKGAVLYYFKKGRYESIITSD